MKDFLNSLGKIGNIIFVFLLGSLSIYFGLAHSFLLMFVADPSILSTVIVGAIFIGIVLYICLLLLRDFDNALFLFFIVSFLLLIFFYNTLDKAL